MNLPNISHFYLFIEKFKVIYIHICIILKIINIDNKCLKNNLINWFDSIFGQISPIFRTMCVCIIFERACPIQKLTFHI